MQHRYVALLLVACTFATLCPLRTFAQDLPSVVLSEIQWGGSSLSTADEWLELANTSDASIDISGWTLTGIGSSGTVLALPEESILLPLTTYLIANYSLGDTKSTLPVPAQLVTSAVSIPNSNLAISLFDAEGTLIDAYSDSGTPDFGDTITSTPIERNLLTGDWASSVPGGTPGTALFPEVPLEETSTAGNFVSEPSPEEQIPSEESPSPSDSETLSSPPEEEEQADVGEDSLQESSSLEALSGDVSEVASEDVEVITLISPVSSSTVVEAISEEELSSSSTTTAPDTSDAEEDSVAETSPSIVVTETFDYSLLRLNEFVSDPTDGKEWIELYNAGSTALDLSYVAVRDASGKQTVLSGTFSGNSYFLIENPAGKLNNDNDTISLLLSDGQTLVTLVYGTDSFSAPQKGFAAGACGDGWRTNLSPTPGAENTCPTTSSQSSSYVSEISTTTSLDIGSADSGDSSTAQGNLSSSEGATSESTSLASVTPLVVQTAATDAEEVSSSADERTSSKKSVSSSPKETSKSTVLDLAIADLDAASSGQRVRVSGVVVAAPGPFGKRVAYLDGVQLYFYKADWPELTAGMLITVTGTWDVDVDSRRIKISSAADITVRGTTSLSPMVLADAEAAWPSGDVLVTASGTLTKKDDDVFVFATDDGVEFRVYDEAKTGVLTAFRAGDMATITGILLAKDGLWVIAPRSDDDAVVTQNSGATSETSASSSSHVSRSSEATSQDTPSNVSTPLIGGGILASTLSALGYWFVRSRKFSFFFSH